ncbi:hypothetical protein BDZ97DRAFT_716401 [Flammula alnicola]|nr:hypothetical protein BDZ97DRAFT_716401 [Flammula alnicola]
MRAAFVNVAVLISSFSLLGAAQSFGGGTDICGEVDAVLKVPSLYYPYKPITFGNINDCLCISKIPSYVSSNPFAISATEVAGRSAVTSALTAMVNACQKQTCHYPAHSVPSCQHGNPCGFTCTDGSVTCNPKKINTPLMSSIFVRSYTPFLYGSHPTTCVCAKPYTLCNGKCGLFKACPSSHPVYKRGMNGPNDHRCAEGLTSCPIIGRGLQSWECVDTENDLESCGGCVLPDHPGMHPEGVDCTAIQDVSDVSCIHGQCVVRRCMPGYAPNLLGDSCVLSEEESYLSETVLVSQA